MVSVWIKYISLLFVFAPPLSESECIMEKNVFRHTSVYIIYLFFLTSTSFIHRTGCLRNAEAWSCDQTFAKYQVYWVHIINKTCSKIDQHLARHFLYFSVCHSCPNTFLCSQILISFKNSIISTNQKHGWNFSQLWNH